MANKKNSAKKSKKRELKQLKIQMIANCRSRRKQFPEIDTEFADGSIGSAIEVENNLTINENFTLEQPVLKALENVSFIALATQNELSNESNHNLSNNEENLPATPASYDLTKNDGDSLRSNNTLDHVLNKHGSFLREQSSKLRVYKGQKQNIKKSKSKENVNIYDAGERLIIDKLYFFEKLKIISNHAPHFGCTLSNLYITGETKVGLNSKLKLSCDMCKAEFTINTTDPLPTQNVDINTAAVSGITSTGIGLEQFRGLCAAMNLPIMTGQMFEKKHVEIYQHWEKTAQQAMAAAAERERQAAIQEGRVKDGIAVIDVIADGCWSKRSYKSNYAALSGAAAIVGRKFKEVFYLGVKNKFCCICARAQNKEVLPKEHKCYKNYTGSSSGMEAEIIAEGFKSSVEMYNIIYGRVIADGDSSTYAKILQERPYKDFTVEKIECRNHILRNMCNKLVAVSIDTKYPLNMRKMLTTQRILAIRKVICSAIRKHKHNTAELGIRIRKLYVDISNSNNHAFGHHDDCLDHYCCSEKQNEDLVSKVKSSAFWAKVQYIVGLVASHSRSLINDCDSNAVEQFNSIIAKFVGGKRTNLIQRQTYQSRCAAAVVAFNTKRPLYNVQKSLLGKSPKSKTKAFEYKRRQRNELRKKVKRVRKLYFSKTQGFTAAADKNYGTDSCQRPDMKEDVYEMAKQNFLKNLEKNDLERSQIERATILQRDSSEWLELRRNLLTASNFGKIINRRATTSASIVKTLLYKSDISNVVSIKHGVDNEATALNQLSRQERLQIRPCGLFIDSEIPFLAATPDGLIGNDAIVEIKCPLSAFKMPIKEAIEKKKIKFWIMKGKEMVINRNHPWFYQIQGQLHITKRNMCLYAVWSGESQMMTVEKIFRDDEFWKKNMIGKLTEFYMEHILPELVDPRKTRNMPLRQPTTSIPKKRQLKEPINSGPSKIVCMQLKEATDAGPSKLACMQVTEATDAGPSKPARMQFCPDTTDHAIDLLSPGPSNREHVLSITEY